MPYLRLFTSTSILGSGACRQPRPPPNSSCQPPPKKLRYVHEILDKVPQKPTDNPVVSPQLDFLYERPHLDALLAPSKLIDVTNHRSE